MIFSWGKINSVGRFVPLALQLCAMSSVSREPYIPPDVSHLTDDAKTWYLRGLSNAERDLSSFPKVIEQLKVHDEGYKIELNKQLASLYKDMKEANENTKVLIPKLNGLVDSMWTWSQPPISTISKLKLKATMWYIDGKRDNLSYYLLNGGGFWCQKRSELLEKECEVEEARKMKKDFDELQDNILLARDSLDDAAQIYVKGVRQLVELIKDVGKNENEINNIIGEMRKSSEERSQGILKNGDDAVEAVKNRMSKLGVAAPYTNCA